MAHLATLQHDLSGGPCLTFPFSFMDCFFFNLTNALVVIFCLFMVTWRVCVPTAATVMRCPKQHICLSDVKFIFLKFEQIKFELCLCTWLSVLANKPCSLFPLLAIQPLKSHLCASDAAFRTICTLDDSHDGLFIRWTTRTMDFSYHGLIRTMDCSYYL